MEFVLPVVALAIMLAGGAGLACLLVPRNRASSIVEVFSLSILFGAGLVSFGSFIAGLVLPGAAIRPVVTVLAVALAAAGALDVRRRPIHVNRLSRLSGLVVVGLTVVALEFAVVAMLAWHDWLDFDGLFMWELKAHLACTNAGSVPLDYFSDPSRTFSHQDYPLFVPLTENWVYEWSGRCGQDLAKLIFPLFYAAAAGLLGSTVSRITRNTGSGLLAASIPFLVPRLVFGSGSATSGYADFAVGTVYLGCACYVLEYLRERNKQVLPLIIALLALLPWIKQEGSLLYLCIASGLLAYAALIGQDRLRIVAGLVAGLVPFIAWRLFVASVGAPSGQDFGPVTVSGFFAHYANTAQAGAWTAGELLNLANWSLLWPLLALSLVLPRVGYAGKERLAIALLIGVPLLLEIHLYIFSNYGGVTQHVASSMPRLILQLAPAAALGLALSAPRWGTHGQLVTTPSRRHTRTAPAARRVAPPMPARSVGEVVESLGLAGVFAPVDASESTIADDQVKTVLVVGKTNPPTYAVCVLLSRTLLDMNGTVRQRLGTRRAAIASADDARAIAGTDTAGLTLLGVPADVPMWVDSRVMARERIVFSNGDDGQIATAPAALCRLPSVQIVNGLAREPEADSRQLIGESTERVTR